MFSPRSQLHTPMIPDTPIAADDPVVTDAADPVLAEAAASSSTTALDDLVTEATASSSTTADTNSS